MLTVKQVNQIDNVRKQLVNCKTESDVEKVFADSQVDDIDVKITILWKSMKLKNVYANPGDEPLTKEKFYEEALAFFVNGPWRELV